MLADSREISRDELIKLMTSGAELDGLTHELDFVEDYAVDFWRASASRPKASLPRTPIQTFAPDDEEERGARLLLLGKAAVLAHRFGVCWLLSWTTTSSRDAGTGAITTRDCASWRGIARATACASKEQRGERRRIYSARCAVSSRALL